MTGNGSADGRVKQAVRARSTRRDRSKPTGLGGAASEWGDVMAKISHDIRTPLNAVIGFADLMHRELHGQLGSDRYREYIGHIRDSGADLLRAAEETLLLALLLGEPGAVKRADTCLAALVLETVGQLGSELTARSVDAAVEVPLDVVVRVDAGATRLALKHLLRCAILSAPSDAALTISAGVDHGVVRLEIEAVPPSSDLPPPALAADAGVPLARAILGLQGAELVEALAGPNARFVVLLECAAQPDFFSGY